MKPDSTVYNANKDKEERIGNLLLMRGRIDSGFRALPE